MAANNAVGKEDLMIESQATMSTSSAGCMKSSSRVSQLPTVSGCTNAAGVHHKTGCRTAPSVHIKEPPVSETRGYDQVEEPEVDDLGGCSLKSLHRAIPVMPLPLAVFCCLLNIVLPGVGTLCSAFGLFCCGTTISGKRAKSFVLNIVSGVLQLASFIVILGWIWSILWGMTFVQLALSETRATKGPPSLPYYVRRHSSIDT